MDVDDHFSYRPLADWLAKELGRARSAASTADDSPRTRAFGTLVASPVFLASSGLDAAA